MAAHEGAGYERIFLIAYKKLRRLYEKAGFERVGLSPLAHVSRPWTQMRRTLASQSLAPPPPAAAPADLWGGSATVVAAAEAKGTAATVFRQRCPGSKRGLGWRSDKYDLLYSEKVAAA
ncbi:hypothetical protein CERSUDRAFT_119589 [Gelatoporia subvermispora B]|uniref:Uncharacterized protein n=1 Tax=Ceriporiopsis subvermispora (strain B) TaxID=914234 RepID=M2Q4J6_CERS8|nr:hypothetical protein CERSUDRAFT_119589 [Gelatoporia subvermispora B]